jgi:hypothetical protein
VAIKVVGFVKAEDELFLRNIKCLAFVLIESIDQLHDFKSDEFSVYHE